MKNKYLFLFGILLFLANSSCIDKKAAITATPEELLASMTLSEKIGQMTQAERSHVQEGDIEKYFLGSILSGGGSSPANNSPKGWVEMVNGFIEESQKTRLKIPILYGLDAVHGNALVQNSTVLPHNVGLGAIAAGNSEKGMQAAYLAGSITAKEMLAAGVLWNFAPVLGVAEDVRWGRTYESYSENTGIVTIMGANFIKGLQDNGAAACMKHFLGEGQTIDGRNQGNALLDRAEIERILVPYYAAIDAGAMSLMPSFSSVNGIKMHENKELLTKLLKEEMGFEGFIVSDWEAISQVTGSSYKEKIANAVNAGVDMVMAAGNRGSWTMFIENMHELVNEGTISMERVDDAVLRILKFKKSIGLFDNPLTKKHGAIGTKENRAAARNLVADSLVLLRNENNVISKMPEYKRILVAGRGAHNIGMQCGGWTASWQGSHGQVRQGTTILEGIQEAAGKKTEIVYEEDGKADGDFDAVIVVIGEDPYAETEGDRTYQINLNTKDMNVLFEAYDYDCPVIVIMLSGRPMTIGDEYLNWDAFVAAWLPGTEGAGIADVLFGDRDFTGRTPYTWRKTINGEVLYPFGFGLTKVNFEYVLKDNGAIITGYNGGVKEVVIPGYIDGFPVTAVGKNAFSRKRLTHVTLPDTITIIEDHAFADNRLTSLILPDSVVYVGMRAFSGNRLSSVIFSKSLEHIGMWAFQSNKLKEIDLPMSLTYIGDGAFMYNSIKSVKVPYSALPFNSKVFDFFEGITWVESE